MRRSQSHHGCNKVKPGLIYKIKFQEWTHENRMRVPVLMGLWTDKKLIEANKEKEMPIKKIQDSKGKNQKASTRKEASSEKKESTGKIISNKKTKEWLNEEKENALVKLNGHELKLTNLGKVYWKKEGYAKRDLLNYYHDIAQYILPYMKNRPQSLNRHPNGIDGISFFQKNVQGKVPGWVETFAEYSESTRETIHYFVCTDEASLIYLANLGCIEMNPWHSTI
ncbi:MAG: DNA ligase, partial [Chitinophagales bacterium]